MLNYSNPFELLITTVLLVQTTDARVSTVAPCLFEACPGPEAPTGTGRLELEDILHPLGFYRTKVASYIDLTASLCVNHGGEVPRTPGELIKLPGVGRKMASVILENAFSVSGITAGTHTGRLAQRRAWTRSKDPVRAEADIACLTPESERTQACHRVTFRGR